MRDFETIAEQYERLNGFTDDVVIVVMYTNPMDGDTSLFNVYESAESFKALINQRSSTLKKDLSAEVKTLK